jgi:ribosome-associated translation inhibitor RaiA
MSLSITSQQMDVTSAICSYLEDKFSKLDK